MIGLALSAAITAATACGSDTKSGGGTQVAAGKAPASVNIGLTSGYNSLVAPFMVAFNDYLPAVAKEFNTTFTTNAYGNISLSQAAFFGGTDQFIITGAAGFIIASIGGQATLAVNQQSTGPLLVVAAPIKYKESRGTDVKAFDGGAWCYLGAGQPTEAAMIGLATSNGLDWSKQKGTAIGAGTAWIPTIASGQCDLSVMSADAAASLSLKNEGYVVANLNDPAIERKVYGGIIMGTILQTTPSFAQQYPELTQAIVKAFTEGLLYVQKNSNDAQAIYSHLPSEYTKKVAPDLFDHAWEIVKVTYADTIGLFDPAQLASTSKFLVSVDQIKDTDKLPDTAYTEEFTRKAYKDLGLPIPDATSTAITTTT
jgi:ABC-type nitrate/sulfonate/bicarbonate transport system substrate-binding protein